MSAKASSAEQLAALAAVTGCLADAGLDYWLFGGWAVDFYVGAVTRAHDDVDLAVWLSDVSEIEALLAADGWRHAPEVDEDGGTGYERDGVRLELTYLVRGEHGDVYIPLHSGPAAWSAASHPSDVREFRGVRVQLVALHSLMRGKSSPRPDHDDAAKDRADFERLRALA